MNFTDLSSYQLLALYLLLFSGCKVAVYKNVTKQTNHAVSNWKPQKYTTKFMGLLLVLRSYKNKKLIS